MPSVFLVSDTHFGHAGVCRFTDDTTGEKIRPWTDPHEMDEAMVKMWNETVKPTDKVYHLGDVVINRKALSIMHRLNGDKVLIKGNHDIFKLEDYTLHFRDIRAYHVMNGMILSHIPLHPESKGRFKCNIHGHLHTNRVKFKNEYGVEKIDPFYFNVSVEQIGFKPMLFEEVMEKIMEQRNHEPFKTFESFGT
jgi:calcineurin-like phosphoesterase family protein